jgi:glycosyltransferase involved in cell wall biosynthesis
MKIAFCHHLKIGYNAGGEQEIAQIAIELAERGHDVSIYALPFSLKGRKLTDHTRLLKGIPYKEAWFHEVACDVAYITYHPLCLANFRTRSPKVAGFHSQVWFRRPSIYYGTVPLLAKLAYDMISKAELGKFDAIHVHDAHLEKGFGQLNKPIHRIPHPIDFDIFKPGGPKGEKFRVLYCGRPEWAKGFDVFLDLADQLKDDGIEFVWLGGDTNHPNITSLGFKYDPVRVASIMSSAHLLLEPQRIDTIGRSALEALAAGTSVLIRANREAVPELPQVEVVQSLEEMKRRIVEHKETWESRRFGEVNAADQLFLDAFSVERVASMYEEMFKSLV